MRNQCGTSAEPARNLDSVSESTSNVMSTVNMPFKPSDVPEECDDGWCGVGDGSGCRVAPNSLCDFQPTPHCCFGPYECEHTNGSATCLFKAGFGKDDLCPRGQMCLPDSAGCTVPPDWQCHHAVAPDCCWGPNSCTRHTLANSTCDPNS